MELPQTLHAQLYLLAYDSKRHQFRFDRWELFGFALRAAMLTDLYLTGYLEDRGGKAWPATAAQPADPVLRAALVGATGREWAQLISYRAHHARQVVRDQLEAAGWVRRQQRRMLGIIPTTRLGLYDEDMVSGLADCVTEALRNAIDGRPTDPRPLAVGLLAVQAQMPVIFSFIENSRHREDLREMTFVAIEPIFGLHQVIQNHYAYVRSRMGNI